MIDYNLISDNYPQPEGKTYLNTSSCGLISKSSAEQAHRFNALLYKYGSNYVEGYVINEIPEVRNTVSKFLDAPINEIALIPSFSYGLNTVLPSISKLKRVLLFRGDYPSLTLPFELNDFEVFWLESKDGFSIQIEDIISALIENKIDVLAISHIQYLTGFTINIEQLSYVCKSQKVLLILDGTQSLGAIPFSFKSSGVNIFITSNYKWMNGGFGTGIMCIDQETLHKFTPKIGGFNSYKYIVEEWRYTPSINSYEPGHLNMAGLSLLKEAIQFKLKLGIENISSHNLTLLHRFTEKIKDSTFQLVGPQHNQERSNIVGIRGSRALEKYLLDHGIIVKMRNEVIRIGIHFYNNKNDIDRLVDYLLAF